MIEIMGKIKLLIKNYLLYIKLYIKYNKITVNIDKSTFISTKAKIIMGKNSTINIGKNCYISDCVRLIVGDNSKLQIDDNVYISINSIISSNSLVSIKKDSMIAHNVTIIDTNKKYDKLGVSIREQGKIVKEVTIGENCWISTGAVILPGVSLGEQCVVAANSVVNKSYQRGTVVGGVPAKIIKEIQED